MKHAVFSHVQFAAVDLGSWFEYEKAWWEHRNDPNVLLLKYEDMHTVSKQYTVYSRRGGIVCLECKTIPVKEEIHNECVCFESMYIEMVGYD